MDYDAVIAECKQIHPIPEGYSIQKSDGENIIVKGPNLGFCITKEQIEEGWHKAIYPAAMQTLIQAESEFLTDPTNPCWNDIPA